MRKQKFEGVEKEDGAREQFLDKELNSRHALGTRAESYLTVHRRGREAALVVPGTHAVIARVINVGCSHSVMRSHPQRRTPLAMSMNITGTKFIDKGFKISYFSMHSRVGPWLYQSR